MKKSIFLAILATISLSSHDAPQKAPITAFIFTTLENNTQVRWCRLLPYGDVCDPYFKGALLNFFIQKNQMMKGGYYATTFPMAHYNLGSEEGIESFFITKSDAAPSMTTQFFNKNIERAAKETFAEED
ncbi:MAG: hypothetical protein K2X90_00305 [Candidatus Babeliaceae bacterium]|nr:hypothetical protein [Candidatus Babeliaceae bacterium]